MPKARFCPWTNYPTHKHNRELRVNGFVPIVTGYCGEDESCSSCAGTTYKPNILTQLGRESTTVPCPHCQPERYKKRVEILKREMRP